MKTRFRLLLLSSLTATLLTGPALAQAASPSSAGDAAEQRRFGARSGEMFAKLAPAEREAMRTRMRAKATTVLTQKLTQRLGLDEAKSTQLAEALQAHGTRMQEQRKQARAELNALKELVDGGASEAAISQQMDRVLARNDDSSGAAGLLEDTREFLTTVEQARLMLALPEVKREVKRSFHKGHKGHKGQKGQKGHKGHKNGRRGHGKNLSP